MSLFVNTINAQHFPKNESGEIEFTEVVETELKKKQLFANAKEWVATTFGDYKSVLQFEDNENCKLIIKGSSAVDFYISKIVPGKSMTVTKEKINYTVTIECKNNRYRYIVNNILIDRTFAMSSISYKSNTTFPPSQHLVNINKATITLNNYKADLDSLNVLDAYEMKKKEKRSHLYRVAKCKKDIEEYKKTIKGEQDFHNHGLAAIKSLVESLKKKMSVNDDF